MQMAERISSDADTPLWCSTTRSFDGGRLHMAIVARGWTVPEFAGIARLHPASVYHALQGRAIRDTTAIRIFAALERRQPAVLSG